MSKCVSTRGCVFDSQFFCDPDHFPDINLKFTYNSQPLLQAQLTLFVMNSFFSEIKADPEVFSPKPQVLPELLPDVCAQLHPPKCDSPFSLLPSDPLVSGQVSSELPNLSHF